MSEWLHIAVPPKGALPDEMADFAAITGEVCASRRRDAHKWAHRRLFGWLIEGVPTASFAEDAWSYVLEDGTREESRGSHRWTSQRWEVWIVPADSKVVGIVTNDPLIFAEARAVGVRAEWYAPTDCRWERNEAAFRDPEMVFHPQTAEVRRNLSWESRRHLDRAWWDAQD